MTLFRPYKSSNQLNKPSHQPLKHDPNPHIRISSDGYSSSIPFSTYIPALSNQLHPNLAHASFSSYSVSSHHHAHQISPLNLSHEPLRSPPSTFLEHPKSTSTSLTRSGSLLGLKTRQPHQSKDLVHSRTPSSMGSHESGYPTPIAPFISSAPSTFRLLKSKIFSSAPSKLKPSQSPKLPTASSSLSRNVYLFPGITSSSDNVDHLFQTYTPEQKVYLIRQRSKSNNMVNRHQESEAQGIRHSSQLPSPPSSLNARSGPSMDFPSSGSSFELSRAVPSIDLPRSVPSAEQLRCGPTQHNHHPPPSNGRIVVDLNSNRLNYPSFNNKPAAQNGPRVLRLNGQLPNSQPDSQATHASSSHRPTPIPHGGSGAILTINASNPIRSAALAQSLRHPDPSSSSMAQHEPVPVRSESLPSNSHLLGAPAPAPEEHTDDPSFHSLETLHITPSGTVASPLRSHHPASQLAFSSDKDGLNYDFPHEGLADPTRLVSSSNSMSTLENSNAPQLTSPPSIVYKSATSQLASLNKSTSARCDSSSDAAAASKQLSHLDFSEFANFLSYSDNTPNSNSTTAVNRNPSPVPILSSQHPTIPTFSVAPIASTHSGQNALSSPPCTPVSVKLSFSSSPSSLRAHSPMQTAKADLTPPPSVSLASTPPKAALASSPLLSPHSNSGSTYSAVLSSSSSQDHETSQPNADPTTHSHPSSPLSLLVSRRIPSGPAPWPQASSPSLKTQLELERARKIILGLENEVQQLKDASLESSGAAPSSSNTNHPQLSNTNHPQLLNTNHPQLSNANHPQLPNTNHPQLSNTIHPQLSNANHPPLSNTNHPQLAVSSTPTTVSQLDDAAQQPKLEPLKYDVPPSSNSFKVSPDQQSAQSFATTASPESSPPKVNLKDEPPNLGLQAESDDELEHTTKPSRLPIAKHRLKDLASIEHAGNLHSRTLSAASTSSRTCKVSQHSNGSTEDRYATSQSQSTYRTTPSPISTSLKPKLQLVTSGNPGHFSGWTRAESPQEQEAWPRSNHDPTNSDLRGGSSLVSRTSERSINKDPRRQIARPSNPSRATSIASHSSSSSGQLARTYAGIPQSRHYNGLMSSTRDQGSHKSASDSYSEHSRHHSRRHVNHSALSSVEEDFALNQEVDESTWSMMTKVELLTVLKNQQGQFAVERQELLDALGQSRERASQSGREWKRLRAEDGWKTEQLNKAREEISWLSRLVDTLEMDKSRLEDRVNSMAQELNRVPSGFRKGAAPTSQGVGSMRDKALLSSSRGHSNRSPANIKTSPRSNDGISLSRSTSKSYSSKAPPSAIHRASYMSGDSARTIIPKELSSKTHESQPHSHSPHAINKWRARESSVSESDSISSGAHQYSAKHRFALAQHSQSEFRLRANTSNLHSPGSDHVESFSSRQRGSRRPTSKPRSTALRRNHSEYQPSEAASSEDERHAETILEVRDDQAHRGNGTRSDYTNHGGFQNSNYSEYQEPLDYQDVASEIDAHKGHSRNDSGESLAISPSSTVFADHQRNHQSRISTYNRHSHNPHRNPNSRNSLISLQLRPEDELFLENYLDDNEILSDDDF